ncbi:hypothetical protein G6F46_014490 [Rhizopus delemar]|nr:hypothetical protein G6F46_014490 [Rhizopus delemar]
MHVHADAGRARHGGGPGHGGFSRIARTPQGQVGDQAQAGGVLDGLVGRAVFAQADRVVGVDVDGMGRDQRAHAHAVARVIAEHQEGGVERNEATYT